MALNRDFLDEIVSDFVSCKCALQQAYVLRKPPKPYNIFLKTCLVSHLSLGLLCRDKAEKMKQNGKKCSSVPS